VFPAGSVQHDSRISLLFPLVILAFRAPWNLPFGVLLWSASLEREWGGHVAMIPARKTRFFNWWFPRHAEKLLRQSFDTVYVRGLEQTVATARERPILLVSNHTSWWDTIAVIYLVPRRLRLDGYAMMDEKNLRRFPFFAKVGAFGVDLGGGAADESLAYATELLSQPERLVLIFAQGRERASTVRPLGFRRGAAVIADRVPDAAVVPLGIRYEVAGTQYPLAFLSLGAPLPPAPDVEQGRSQQEAAVTGLLEDLDHTVVRLRDGEPDVLAQQGYAPVLRRPTGLMGPFAQWILATVNRRFARARRRDPPAP